MNYLFVCPVLRSYMVNYVYTHVQGTSEPTRFGGRSHINPGPSISTQ